MMNILALSLVLTSLATAGVWSPSPDHEKKQTSTAQSPSEAVIVQEIGHRVVVVEYEKKGDGNTKVSISPHDVDDKSYVSVAKDKIKEAASVLPNMGQGLSGSDPPPNTQTTSAKELVCDAFGKCKHKIASSLGKAKEKASEVEEEAEEAVTDALGKAKERVSHKAHEAAEKAKHGEEEAKEAVTEALGKAKERVSEKAHEAAEKAKHSAETMVKKSTTIGKDVKQNVSVDAEIAKEEAAKKAKQAHAHAHGLKEEGKKELKDILRRSREVVYDVAAYLAWPGTVDLLWVVVHLIGFSTAYGVCMWVTFVSSYVLAEALPRQQFAIIQSKMYPVYFRAMAYSLGLALVGHLLSQRKRLFSNLAEMFQVYNLVVALLKNLANLYYLEPRATKVVFERMKMEKEEGRGREGFMAEPSSKVSKPGTDRAAPSVTGATTTPTFPESTAERLEQEAVKSRFVGLNERLKKLNNYSSFLNICTLMALTWHLVYLAQRLQVKC